MGIIIIIMTGKITKNVVNDAYTLKGEGSEDKRKDEKY